MVCDVNGLKFINDTLGHQSGDEYICAACKLVCKTFAHSPVYRVGGDEFVAFLAGEDYEARAALLEKIDRQSETNIGSKDVVVSAGLAEYVPGEDADVHAVFERADARMYARKKQLKAMGAATR